MKITEIKTFLVNPTGHSRNWIFVKICTDEGVYGIGEAFNTGKVKATEAVIHNYGRYLIGKDPRKIIHHWQAIYCSSRFPLGTVSMGALSSVEHALWDITGKLYGQPIHRLLGGACRKKIKVYTHTRGNTPEELASHSKSLVKKGYSAIKFTPHPPKYEKLNHHAIVKSAYRRVKAVRDAVGEEVDICLDYHSADTSVANAIMMLKILEPLRPAFLEEPILHENIDAMAEVKANTTIPIATGERLFTRYGFRELLEKRAVDIIQPDPIVCGGILETLRIASMAETYYITIAPHNPFGPVATAVCVQIAACAPNFAILEHIPDDIPPRNKIMYNYIKFRDGYLDLPTNPGLGVDLNEKVLENYPYEPWDRKVVILEDGSVGLA